MSPMQALRWGRTCATLALAAALVAPYAADAKDSAGATKAAGLPEPLTREAVRELVSRMSDEDVRKLLIDQLDKAAAASAPKAKGDGGMTGMTGMVEHNAGMMRSRGEELEAAAVAFPATLEATAVKVTEPDGSARLALIVAAIGAFLLLGWIAEKLCARALRNYRARLEQAAATTFTARAFQRGVLLLLDIAGLVVFALVALGAHVAMWHPQHLQRALMLITIVAVIGVRLVALLARFLLAPRRAANRLLPFADAPARTLYRFSLAFATVGAIDAVVILLLRRAGADETTVDIVEVCAALIGITLVVGTAWRVREPIATLIRGDGTHGAVVRWIADLWHVFAIAYFLGIFAVRVYDIVAGTPDAFGVGFASVLLVIALPMVDMALCRGLAAAVAGEPVPGGERVRGIATSYEPVFRRAIHIVVLVVGLLLFGGLWGINIFELAQRSMGGRISSSLLGVAIVLLLAYILWEAAKTAIDRRLASEDEFDPEHPASRLRTLLPILRILILATIATMTIMSVLAALGVDILPLLAGASVIGVAIGFGSQTLVRDIVSGAFFLMDDAFRLGEYIEVGDAKGRVEKINVRSVFLRHHRGAINILPYGEIKRLRNTSRDWMVFVMDFRLTYDTNLMTVKKILKTIGDEISADAELAPDLIRPLKMGGVLSTEDSAIVVRAKFTARPEGEPWMIQKAAYAKILKAFREAGIKFAHKQVTVNMPQSIDGDKAAIAAEGAAALAAQAATARG